MVRRFRLGAFVDYGHSNAHGSELSDVSVNVTTSDFGVAVANDSGCVLNALSSSVNVSD